MGTKEKAIKRLKSLPKDFTFREMQSLLKSLGYIENNKGKTSGSRVRFKRKSSAIEIHKPHPEKHLKVGAMKAIIMELETEELI